MPGTTAASSASGGPFPFATSSKELKGSDNWSFDNEAICIPIVSATGHGHAAINSLHYMNGQFDAATITAVLLPLSEDVDVRFVYNFLLTHKDDVLVPLMRGATNVTLNLERLRDLEIPMPDEKRRNEALSKINTAERRCAELVECLGEARNQIVEERSAFREKLLMM